MPSLGIEGLPAFVAAALLLMFIPGVDMALVTRQMVVHGRGTAFVTVAGLLASGLCHAALASAGLTAILMTSSAVYGTLRLVGGGYLIAVGVYSIWASLARTRANDEKQAPAGPLPRRRMTARRAFALGFLSNITNPKVAVFFLTFLPQFVSPGRGSAAGIAVLGILFNAIASSWWVAYLLLLDRMARWLARRDVRRVVENVSGGVLIALGLRVATERR